MNWIDMVLIGTLAAGGLLGMWIGMVRASFGVIGVVAGFAVAAQYRGGAESWLAGYLANETLVVILSYVIVVSATAAVTLMAAGIARRLVYGMFMGWADRLAGMTAGLAVGAFLAGAVILGIAGLAHTGYSLDEGLAGKVMSYTPFDARFDAVTFSGLEAKLTESSVVSILVTAADIIPDKAFDLAPEDWRDTLDLLQRRLQSMDTARR